MTWREIQSRLGVWWCGKRGHDPGRMTWQTATSEYGRCRFCGTDIWREVAS